MFVEVIDAPPGMAEMYFFGLTVSMAYRVRVLASDFNVFDR